MNRSLGFCALVCALMFAGTACGAAFFFDGGGGDSLWTDPLNWDADSGYPGDANNLDAVVIARSEANGKRALVVAGDDLTVDFFTQWGGSAPGDDGIDMTGGTMNIVGNFEMGSNEDNNPIELNVSGGVINAGSSTLGGFPCCGNPTTDSDATLNVSGTGQVNVAGNLRIGVDNAAAADSDAFLNLWGAGMVSVGSLDLTTTNPNTGVTINDTALLKIGGDVLADIDAHIAAGRISGSGAVARYADGLDITIVGVPEPSTFALVAFGLVGLIGRRRR